MGDQTLSYTDIFWIQYSHPYIWLFFFLSTGYVLKSNPLLQPLQSAQVLSLTLLLQGYFANPIFTWLFSDYLTTFWIFRCFLSHLYTVPSRALFPSQMNNKNMYLPLLAAVPKRNNGYRPQHPVACDGNSAVGQLSSHPSSAQELGCTQRLLWFQLLIL